MTAWSDTAVPCYDPDCTGVAEPEQDGGHRYHACTSCGYSFNYESVPTEAGSCELGVPEAVRRAASVAPPTPLLLQIGRRRDDAS